MIIIGNNSGRNPRVPENSFCKTYFDTTFRYPGGGVIRHCLHLYIKPGTYLLKPTKTGQFL